MKRKLYCLIGCVLAFAGSARSQNILTSVNAASYQHAAENFNLRCLDDIPQARDRAHYAVSCFTSEMFFNIGVESLEFNSLEINNGDFSREDAKLLPVSDFLSNPQTGSISYRVVQNGATLAEKGPALSSEGAWPELHLAEFGPWYNNRMIGNLNFEPALDVHNDFTGIQLANWHDRLLINFLLRSNEDITNGQQELTLQLPGEYNLYTDSGEGVHSFFNDAGEGFSVRGSSHAESLAVWGDASGGYSVTVTGIEQNIASNTSYEVGMILQAGNEGSAAAAETLKDEINNEVIVTSEEIMPSSEINGVTYDEDAGMHRITPSAYNMGQRYVENSDVVQRLEFAVENPTDAEKRVKLCFEGTGNITGYAVNIGSRGGAPSGIPVQVSKNWHNSDIGFGGGSWAYAYSELVVPANTTLELDYTVSGAKWGGVFGAHSHQLSLCGLNRHSHGWLEAILGGYGESICHSPDYWAGMGTDWRAFLSAYVADPETETATPSYMFLENHGGLDVSRYEDSEGMQAIAESRTDFIKYGPNLTETEVVYFSEDRKVRTSFTFSLNRAMDLARTYYRVKVDFLENTDFESFRFFQLGSDSYTKAYTRDDVVYGNENGFLGSFTPNHAGGNTFSGDAIGLSGETAWVWAGDPLAETQTCSRAMIVTDYQASFNGSDYNTPYLQEWSASTAETGASYCLVPPPAVTSFTAGDSVEFLAEVLLLPKHASFYFGSNDLFRAALEEYGNSWEMVYREAVENRIQAVSASNTVDQSYPLEVYTDDHDEAFVEVQGGIEYVPIVFRNVSSISNVPKLWREVDGAWERVDQSTVGNDFWQVEYNEDNDSFDVIFNIDQSIAASGEESVQYFFGRLLQANRAPEALAGNAYVVEGGSVEIALNGSDADGDSLSYEVVVQPENGSLSGSGETWTYVPDAGFTGADLLAFTVSDGLEESEPAPVKITVTPALGGTAGHWPLDDGRGTVVSDVSGAGNDGTLAGASWISGQDGGALKFSGSSSSGTVEIPAEVFDGVGDGISISMWACGDPDLQPRKDAVFTAEDAGGSRVLNIHLPWSDAVVYWDAGGSGSYDRINKTASSEEYAGQWNHWVFTKDAAAGTMAIYLNGALWHSGTGKTAPMGTVAAAAFGSGVGENYYEGSLDDVRVYTYALSDEQVSTLYTGYNTQPVAYDISVGVAENGSAAVVLSGLDPEGGRLSYELLSDPVNGTLSGGITNLTYTPDTGYTGSDSFTYRVNDGTFDSGPAAVSIAVSAAPTADDIEETVDEDGAVAIILSGSDPEGSNLTYNVETLPSNGTLSGTAPNLIYTPEPNYFGSDTFTYTVNDGISDSAPAVVSIMVSPVNDAPAAHDQTVRVRVNGSVQITLSGSDADGDTLGYTVVSSPGDGTLSGTEPLLTYTPDAGFSGADSFTFTVTDGLASSAPAAVSIAVLDDAEWIDWADAVNISGTADVSTNGTPVWAYSFGASGSFLVNGVLFSGESSPSGSADVTTDLDQTYTGYGNGSGLFSTLAPAYQDMLESGAFSGGSDPTITLNGLTVGSEYEVQFWVNDSRNRSDMDSIPRIATVADTSYVVDYNTAGANTDNGLGQWIIGTFTADASTQDIELESVVPQLNAIQLRMLAEPDSDPDVYSVWAAAYGLTGADALLTADAENDGLGDGYDNLAEFALGMDPSASDAGSGISAGTIYGETNWFELVHFRRADYMELDLSYLLIEFTNLTGAATLTNAQDQIIVGAAVDGYEPVTNRYRADESSKFIQLMIQQD